MGRKMDGAVQFRQMCSSANNKKKELVQIIYILHGHNLEQISSSKYIRVTITSDLKWSAHIQNICQKSNRTIWFLKRVQSYSVIMTTLSLNNVDNKASFWITTSIPGFIPRSRIYPDSQLLPTHTRARAHTHSHTRLMGAFNHLTRCRLSIFNGNTCTWWILDRDH